MHWASWEPLTLISDAWIVLAIYWAISALRVKQMKYIAPTRVRVIQLVFLIPGAYLLYVRHTKLALLQIAVLPKLPTVTAIGVAVAWIGIALALWARYVLGSNWSAQVAIREGHELIQTGPYRFIRHPIYTGILTGTWGTAIAIGQLSAFFGVILITLGLAYKAKQEELRLQATFGEMWTAHQQRTGMFLPRTR
jgi:protein-S-isoprenylcysteine O-methyltransferase Ste14